MAPIRDLLDQSLTRLEMLYEKDDLITGVPTGYQGLDELMSGLQPSSLVIVGARPATGKCLTGDTLLTDPRSGDRTTLAELYQRGRRGAVVEVTSLGLRDQRLRVRRPSAFVDDGVRPVFRVRTRLGREVSTTATHPFLTPTGWRPLADVTVGTPVAVPRALPIFGHQPLPETEVVLLAYLLGYGASTTASVRFSTGSSAVMADVVHHARSLGVAPVAQRRVGAMSTCRLAAPLDHPDPVVELLRRHDVMGVSDHARSVPRAVFRLPRRQCALFLNRLLGADGSPWWSPRGGGSACISYSSVSPRLVADVAHLLLRFGINARIRRRVVRRQDWRGPAHELEVTSVPEVRRLAAEIGMFSKEAALANLLRRIDHQSHHGPPGVEAVTYPRVEGAVARVDSRPLARIGAGEGAGRARGPWSSPTAGTAAPVLDPAPAPCGSAVLWDEIVAIEAAGDARVYDLTVPGDHNFVAADIFVHNTAFALGMAAHAALEVHRPVLFFSLEMSHLEITQRLIAAEARVDSTRMRNGRLAESDWGKISHAIGRLAEAPLYIDDNPRATVLEIRAKSRRLKSRLGDLGMVVVDYLQLMTGRDRAENRQVEVSEISRGLKVLARELETPVVALSQLSRGLELRADKRPMLADLRESGCLTADARVLRADTGAEATMAELLLSGETDIPVWTLDRGLRLVPGTMTRVFSSGVKQVYELRLASGRRIKASANHPFLTHGGWLRLDELRPGIRVAVPLRVPSPTQVDTRHWEALDLAPYASFLDGAAPDRQCISQRVFSLPDESLAGVLRDLWPSGGSGHHGHRGGLQYASASHRVVDDLQMLLLRFEIQSRVVRTKGQAGTGLQACLSITGGESRLRFVDLIQGERSAGSGLQPWAPAALAMLPAAAVVGAAPGPGTSVPSRDRLARVAALLDDPELDRRARADVRWDAVVAVESLGEEPVYDATVPETHNFVANGIVVENSLEQDADVVIFLYRDELYHPESPDRGTAEVLVAKHRSGPTGMERLAFLDHYTRFANMAKGI
jgi:replicative DNA helicase